jgi:hypothetical protein
VFYLSKYGFLTHGLLTTDAEPHSQKQKKKKKKKVPYGSHHHCCRSQSRFMLVNDVVLGRTKQYRATATALQAAPPGFDST